jgi:hypothetical protein
MHGQAKQTDVTLVTTGASSPPTPWLQSSCTKRRPVGSHETAAPTVFFSRGLFFSQTGYLFIIQTRKVKKVEETETPAEVD